MTKSLIALCVLFVAGVAGGEPTCVPDESLFMVDAAGKETCFNFVEFEKRIKALEDRAHTQDVHGTHEMKCVEGDMLMCDGPSCWCGEPIR